MSAIEYVIYCRKSTDESSGMQNQSIPDQIRKCVDYAKNNWLSIAKKNENFCDFETDIDIKKEDSDPDLYNRQIFQEVREYFVIKEQSTAKIPWSRPKWKKLIKLVKQGKIRWLLSYSPDRQARNMVEWGELIDCVDQNLIDLKYTNFHFEPTASGKMMLGIRFVFSKQYSDKLSEDITRWNQTKKTQGKSLWKFKYWYFTNSEQYYEPHPVYFSLMRTAFEMKLYENKSDDEIAKWLNAHWFLRELKERSKSVEAKRLWDLWRNEFYYGMYISNDAYYDMRELNPYFKPLITDQEFFALQDKLRSTWSRPKKVKDTNKVYYPFERWMLITEDNTRFTCTLPNPARFDINLKKLKLTKPNSTLADVVSPHQIKLTVMNKKSSYNKLSFPFSEIEDYIVRFLNKINITENMYMQYVEFIKTQLDAINIKRRQESNKLQVRLNNLMSERKNYIKRHMWFDFSTEEQKIYQEELESFDFKLEQIQSDLIQVNDSERNEVLEASIFLDILRKAWTYYKKASYVQKRKITNILFSNIIVDKEKRLHIKVKPSIYPLFSHFLEMTGFEPVSQKHI